MSTLGYVSSERPREDSISWSQVAGSINLAFNWYQLYWKCLQWSKSKEWAHVWAHVQESSVLWLELVGMAVVSKKPSFQNHNFPVDTHSITVSRYWFSITQRHHILMQQLENGVARGEPEVHHVVSILHTAASLKAV